LIFRFRIQEPKSLPKHPRFRVLRRLKQALTERKQLVLSLAKKVQLFTCPQADRVEM